MDLKEKTFQLVSADRSADKSYPRKRLNTSGLLRLNSANLDAFGKGVVLGFAHVERLLAG